MSHIITVTISGGYDYSTLEARLKEGYEIVTSFWEDNYKETDSTGYMSHRGGQGFYILKHPDYDVVTEWQGKVDREAARANNLYKDKQEVAKEASKAKEAEKEAKRKVGQLTWKIEQLTDELNSNKRAMERARLIEADLRKIRDAIGEIQFKQIVGGSG